MTEKTEAIILQYNKYGDNKLMINTFSRENGRMSFSAVIPVSRYKNSVLPYCQPLFQNEIEYSGSNSNIKKITKISPSYTYATIPFNTAKMSTAMFLAEVLGKILTFSEENSEMFDYITTSLKILDDPDYKGYNFHLKFLMQLAKYIGFYPINRYSEFSDCFDISKSAFTVDNPGSPHIIREPYSEIFSRILDTDITTVDSIELNGAGRSYLLEKIIDYYRYRFDTLNTIKSLEVLQAVYH
jgi:DNA repair protein RecO (recombination protein O)